MMQCIGASNFVSLQQGTAIITFTNVRMNGRPVFCLWVPGVPC